AHSRRCRDITTSNDCRETSRVTAALKILSGAQLRVALLAPDTLRRRTFSKILVDAEYTVVEIDDRPDIVLADGVSVPSNEDRPVVILGDSDQSAQGFATASRQRASDRCRIARGRSWIVRALSRCDRTRLS